MTILLIALHPSIDVISTNNLRPYRPTYNLRLKREDLEHKWHLRLGYIRL